MKSNLIILMPARAGSKRMPGKNTKDFCGMPIYQYVIQKLINNIDYRYLILTTDDTKILQTRIYNPKKIWITKRDIYADDKATLYDVCSYVMNVSWSNCEILLVYPTAVLLDINDIQTARCLIDKYDCIYPTYNAAHVGEWFLFRGKHIFQNNSIITSNCYKIEKTYPGVDIHTQDDFDAARKVFCNIYKEK